MNKRYLLGSILVLTLAACTDPLAVANNNSPDRNRTFTNAADLEVFTAGLFAVMIQSTIGGSNDGLQTQMLTMSMENTSTLANFAMGPRGALPRNSISNQRGSQGSAGNYHDWFRGHRAARQAVLALAALKNLPLSSPAATVRAQAFARLVQGIALGNLSLAYDSASILTENDNPEADAAVVVPLSNYWAVNRAALGYLDSAIALATANPTAFPLPSVANFWINGGSFSNTNFIALARSYQAKFRANVARTPAERRDSVNWTQVIADANAGIQTDFAPQFDQPNGWDVSWVAQHFTTGAGAWHQMSQFWIGMADTSGGYAAWLNTALNSKVQFLVVTPDRRFPGGANCVAPCPPAARTAQSAAAGTGSAGQAFANTPYFRNRPSGDVAGDPLQVSMYDFWRSRQFRQALRIGPYPIITAAEIRLLAAEGYIRTNNFPAAIVRINATRGDSVGLGKGFLPRIPLTVADTVTRVPGTAVNCVPKIPDPAQLYKGTICGNVWDALKYEYRLETAYTGYGNWFFPERGWGDLPQNTATQWPVPYQEMDARRKPFYGFGGGGPSSSAPGNYGLFVGGVY